MRIAYVITRADAVGGATVHVRDLASGLRERGHDAWVFVGGEGPVTEQLEAAGVPFVVVRSLGRTIHPLRDAEAYRELRKALRAFRPDLVSAHTAKAGWIGRLAARAERVPCVYTPHGWAIGDRISRTQGAVYTVAERMAAPWARAIVCVSESEKRLALEKRIAPPEKLHVIHNGVRDIPPELVANPGAEPAQIISVARFEAPKDHRTLLDALATLNHLKWRVELVGEGPMLPEMQAYAERLGLTERSQFCGYQQETAEALARSSIFVLSSRSEGFPRSILEAMRAGLPVVAADVGGVREAVVDGVTGLLFPAGNAAALAKALEELLRSPENRQRIGSSAHLRYRGEFSFERMLNSTLRLYVTIVVVPPGT